MEVPGLRVELELQLPAYTTATEVPDLSQVCNLQTCSIAHGNPLIVAKNQILILMYTSWFHYR